MKNISIISTTCTILIFFLAVKYATGKNVYPKVQDVNLKSQQRVLNRVKRIVGGRAVTRSQACTKPYNQAAAINFILNETSMVNITVCSGVILSDRIIATAGRCVFSLTQQALATKFQVIVGQFDLQAPDQLEKIVGIESVKVHFAYNNNTRANNIALIRLQESINFNQCVQPAVRPNEVDNDPTIPTDFDGTCITMGWGLNSENSGFLGNSIRPRTVDINLMGSFISSILSTQLAGFSQPLGSILALPKDDRFKVCYLDWGAMVSCRHKDVWVWKGIVNEQNCDQSTRTPVVVTDVSAYRSWLDGCLQSWTDNCPSL